MRHKLFGRSGLRVSELCLGTQTFGENWGSMGSDRTASRLVFDRFVEAGGTFFDSAYVYNEGASETLLGEFIAGGRDRFVIASKYTPTLATEGKHGPAAGNGRKNMVRSVEASLRRLKTDYIDLYYLHWWDDTAPLDEIMRGLDDLVSAGKVLYVAASDTPAWQVSRANMLADFRGWAPFVGIQVQYSLVERTAERELIPMARELDLAVAAWSPLAGGVLTGKYLSGPEEGRLARAQIDERSLQITRTVAAVADEIGRPPAQVALAALRGRPGAPPIIPIIGARTAEQLEASLGSVDVMLDDEQRARLDAVSKIDAGFPHDFLEAPWMLVQYRSDLLDNHRAR